MPLPTRIKFSGEFVIRNPTKETSTEEVAEVIRQFLLVDYGKDSYDAARIALKHSQTTVENIQVEIVESA